MNYILEGLDCAHCAAKIERELNKIEGLEPVSVNFAA
ncbi:MAG: heavy metal-associated domain-containing protein, partial [bacterium]